MHLVADILTKGVRAVRDPGFIDRVLKSIYPIML